MILVDYLMDQEWVSEDQVHDVRAKTGKGRDCTQDTCMSVSSNDNLVGSRTFGGCR
jgi:hypothetical protein